jgi:nicotinamide-nucleotide amidase
MTMPEINRRQAMVPRGAAVLTIPTARRPACGSRRGRTALLLLPGPPREMKPMLEAVIRDRLAPKAGGPGLFRRVLKITGRAESDVDAQAQPVYGTWTPQARPISTTILAVLGQIELHLTAQAASRADAEAALDRRSANCRRRSGRSSTASTARRSKRWSAICCASAR